MTNEEAIKWIERFELAFPLPIEDYIDAKEALDMAIKALEQQPCEDCISRQEALKVMCDKCPMYNCVMGCSSYRHIEKMPSVTPKAKIGHWIINEDEENTVHGHCSVCGWEAHYYEDDIIGMSYCPNCGAKMEVEE